VVGERGVRERLGFTSVGRSKLPHDLVPWDRVTGMTPRRVTVKDGTTPE
jgi:hypothetical protein